MLFPLFNIRTLVAFIANARYIFYNVVKYPTRELVIYSGIPGCINWMSVYLDGKQ